MKKTFKQFSEEIGGTAVGNGQIAGVGVGPEGEPPVSKKVQSEIVKKGEKKKFRSVLTTVGLKN